MSSWPRSGYARPDAWEAVALPGPRLFVSRVLIATESVEDWVKREHQSELRKSVGSSAGNGVVDLGRSLAVALLLIAKLGSEKEVFVWRVADLGTWLSRSMSRATIDAQPGKPSPRRPDTSARIA
jgi:hypothetical protein